MRARKNWLALTGSFAVLSLNLSPIAASAQSQDDLGPGTVVFDNSKVQLKFSDFKDSVIGGTKGAHGEGRWTSPPFSPGPNEGPMGGEQLAMNPGSCRQRVRVGHIVNRPADPTNGSSLISSSLARPLRASGYVSAGAQEHGFRTSWYDPPGAEVNHVLDDVYYEWDSSGAVTYCNGVHQLWWLSETGWVLNTQSLYVDLPDYRTCRARSYVEYWNSPFRFPGCSGTGNGTGVDYWPNTVEGYTNNSGSGWASTWAFGICANFLHQSWSYF